MTQVGLRGQEIHSHTHLVCLLKLTIFAGISLFQGVMAVLNALSTRLLSSIPVHNTDPVTVQSDTAVITAQGPLLATVIPDISSHLASVEFIQLDHLPSVPADVKVSVEEENLFVSKNANEKPQFIWCRELKVKSCVKSLDVHLSVPDGSPLSN